MVELDERHHTFLQALMRRGPLPDDESKRMFRELFECADDMFFDFISCVNKELDYLQLEVRGSANQYNGMVYYGLVNKLASEEAKLGTRLTHAQLTFFKAVMESILSEPTASGVISSMQALNLRLDTQVDTQTQGEASTSQAAPLRLTLAAKEETLASLVSENWLSRTDDGRIALGVKSFLELRSLFKNFDVPFCNVCNEAAIKAQPCQNEDCNVRMHAYCVPRKFNRRQVPRVCPDCGTAWRGVEDEEDPPAVRLADGDESDDDDDDDDEENGRDENDEEEDTEVPAAGPPPRRVAHNGSRSKVKARVPDSDDDHVKNGHHVEADDDDEDDDAERAPAAAALQPRRRSLHSRPKIKAHRR